MTLTPCGLCRRVLHVKQENGETIYTFHYKDAEEEKYDLTLTYNPVSETIKLKNKNDIWEKVKLESPGQ